MTDIGRGLLEPTLHFVHDDDVVTDLDVSCMYLNPTVLLNVNQQEPVPMNAAIAPAAAETAVVESMADIVAASQESTIAAKALLQPTGKGGKKLKPTKDQKKQFRKMLQQNQKMGRSLQSSAIMSALQRHVIKTPEQLMIEKAVANTHTFLVKVLGERQARAFFKAGPDTLAAKFFTDAFCAANPTVVADSTGRQRTLTEIHEYFIQRELIKLAQVADETNPLLGLTKGLEETFDGAGKAVDPELPVDVADMEPDRAMEEEFKANVFKPTEATADEPEAFLAVERPTHEADRLIIDSLQAK